MDNYFTFTRLLGLRDSQGSNLPLFKQVRNQRLASVQKMMSLIEVASATQPKVPNLIMNLNPVDPEWDDQMPFPVIDRMKYVRYAGGICFSLFFYGYNYNVFSQNIQYITFRNIFPIAITCLFAHAYSSYRKQILKINLFDQYCYLRSKELVDQNKYLLNHPDVEKYVWWFDDFKDTMGKIYRQANDHKTSDFKDSEIILQDFINRYVDPTAKSPMKNHPIL